jgi:hypothetical protein
MVRQVSQMFLRLFQTLAKHTLSLDPRLRSTARLAFVSSWIGFGRPSRRGGWRPEKPPIAEPREPGASFEDTHHHAAWLASGNSPRLWHHPARMREAVQYRILIPLD